MNRAISVEHDTITINTIVFRFNFNLYVKELIQDILTFQYTGQNIVVNANDGENLGAIGFYEFLSQLCADLNIDRKKITVYTDDPTAARYFNHVDTSLTIFHKTKAYVNAESRALNESARFVGCTVGRFSPARLRLLYELDRNFGLDAFLIAQFVKDPSQLNWYKVNGGKAHRQMTLWCKSFKFESDPYFEITNNSNSVYGWIASAQTYHTIAGQFEIEVVVETDCFSNWWFTEKTARCLALGKPFLLFAGTNSLNRLREMGYKTFDSVIDESYDQAKTPGLRTEKIIQSLGALFLSPNRKECMQKLYAIADLNRSIYINKSNV